MIRYLAALIMAFIIVHPGIAHAESPIGTIIEVEGNASATHDGTAGVAAIDDPVYLGDVLETGDNSKLLVLFEDETEFTLSENSRLTVDEYVYSPDEPQENKAGFSVLRGAFLYVSGLIAKNDPSDVGVETPYGSIGIRGTTFWGGPVDGEYGIFVEEGAVTVTNDRARVKVGTGQGVSLRARNAMPDQVKTWGQEKIARVRKTVALKRQDAVKARLQDVKQRHRALLEQKRRDWQQKRLDLQNLSPEERQKLIQERKGQMQENIQDHKEQIREKIQDKKESALPPAERKEQLKKQIRKKRELKRSND